MDVKLLTGVAVTFGVLAQYLAGVGCTTGHLVGLVTSLQGLVDHIASASPTLLPRPWMMAVADSVQDPAVAEALLAHGQRAVTQCLATGMVRTRSCWHVRAVLFLMFSSFTQV